MKASELLDRFTLGDDCWEWTGSVDKRWGYGKVFFDGRSHRAHRVVYEWLVGPIPQGLVIDHLCKNKSCVNPKHLEPVTQATNVQRGDLWKVHGLKTECVNGHPYDEVNTRRNADGRRACRTCHRESMRRRRSKL